ncbi:hypothetical protein FAP39_13160 [Shimia litoralis]|uniref:Tetratricopeptide repeat protein n=1 Tax=Shimia litoralis TaxID=420403 RepID=A0A4U7MXT2_9RHOB|nr:hypothetical protein [Shimia litoralis]TKZ18019.1 hypothetical protein FAP39_13160 [Shimia litoralis]
MRGLAKILCTGCLSFCLATSVPAQQTHDFDTVVAGLEEVLATGQGDEAAYLYLTNVLRTARASGTITPDFAIFYAMLTDVVRNYKKNPGFALILAEEGLALIAGDASQDDFRPILQVSLSYALADMGRLQEAYQLSVLITPKLRNIFDDAMADSYEADAAYWGQGTLSKFNSAATDLARDVLERAASHLQQNQFASVLSLTSTAVLPLDMGLDDREVRRLNAELELLNGRALTGLGRGVDSANAYLRALGYLTTSPWDFHGAPDWNSPEPLSAEFAEMSFDILTELASVASNLGRRDIETAALEAAIPLADDHDEQIEMMLRQAVSAVVDGDMEKSLRLLGAFRDTAVETGDVVNQLAAEYYIHLARAFIAIRQERPIHSAGLIASTDALMAYYQENMLSDGAFFLKDATRALAYSDAFAKTLDYARRSLWSRQAALNTREDTVFGARAAKQEAHGILESFLLAAHNASAAGLDARLMAPDCDDVHGFLGCTIYQAPQ